MTRNVKPTAREKVLQTAGELFYRQGFVAVGVDTIVAQSGVAKMSLYRHFKSKDALIEAYLLHAHEQFMGWFLAQQEGKDTPLEKLHAIFDGLDVLTSSPRCRGCAFVVAAAEFPDQEHVGHVVARTHKTQVMKHLGGLARKAGVEQPALLARQLLLLMDGAFASVRVFGHRQPTQAGPAARALIAAALPPGKKRSLKAR